MAILRVLSTLSPLIRAPQPVVISGTVEDAFEEPAARIISAYRNGVDFGTSGKTLSDGSSGAYSLTVRANPGDSFRVEALGAAGENSQVLDGIVPIPAE